MINEVIVIKEQDYQEFDKLITFFSQEGIFTLICQGINKPQAHNRNSLLYFMKIEIDYFLRTKNKIGKLKTAKCLIFYKNIYSNTKLIPFGLLILKIINNIEETNINYLKAFNLTIKTFEILEQADDGIYASFYFMFNYLLLNNIKFNTQCCVRTKTKANIISINLADGGFISEQGFLNNKDKIYSKTLLKHFKDINDKDITNFQKLDKLNQVILWKIVYDYYIKQLGYFLPIINFKDILSEKK